MFLRKSIFMIRLQITVLLLQFYLGGGELLLFSICFDSQEKNMYAPSTLSTCLFA